MSDSNPTPLADSAVIRIHDIASASEGLRGQRLGMLDSQLCAAVADTVLRTATVCTPMREHPKE
eukprot:6212247-Pleurochrysis_carterae.AAC.1